MFKGRILTRPLCSRAKTLSFRLEDDAFKTANAVFFDQNADVFEAETPESCFTNSSENRSLSTESSRQDLDSESVETVVRGVVRSERLFFEPGDTSSIVDEIKVDRTKDRNRSPLEETVMVEMESEDPYGDFRKSMEEMVMSNEQLARDWDCLETMLGQYLKMNDKDKHGVIVRAFVDLLISLAGGSFSNSDSDFASASVSPSTYDSACCSSAISSFSSSPMYSSRGHTEIEEEEEEEDKIA